MVICVVVDSRNVNMDGRRKRTVIVVVGDVITVLIGMVLVGVRFVVVCIDLV